MARETKPAVSFEDTFEKLEIRLGKIIDAEIETTGSNQVYKMTVDFGKFGKRVACGRFTHHQIEEVKGRLVIGVLNLEPKQMGNTLSEARILGIQYPKADSGEAAFVSPAADCKIGSKLF